MRTSRVLPPRAVARLTALLSLVAAGCGGDRPAPPPQTPTVVAPRPPAPGDPSCPRDGTWKPCALLDRVVKAGLVFKPAGDSMRVAYLSTPGVRYQVGRTASLVAFFYDDSTALRRDLAKLDTLRLTPPGDSLGAWPSVPTVIRSANLVAVVLGGSATQVERLGLTITAGPPQPSTAPPDTAPQLLPSQSIRPR